MKSKTKKAIQAVLLAFVFCLAQPFVLSVPQGGASKSKAPAQKKNEGSKAHEDSGKGNDPPCRRGSNPSPKKTCGQPHPEDPADCDCGIGNDGQRPQPNN